MSTTLFSIKAHILYLATYIIPRKLKKIGLFGEIWNFENTQYNT